MSAPPEKGRKKRYSERPDVRMKLLDAAENLIRDEGYASATVRRIAKQAGLTHQAVFYYFGSLDELLLALYRRTADKHEERLSQALNSENPIRAMWDVVRDPSATGLGLEFLALANHNDAVRAEIAARAESFRELEAKAIERHLEARGITPRLSPQMVAILTNALARLLVQESTLGIHAGHDEAEALVEASFTNFETRGDSNADMEPIVGAIGSPK